MVPSPRSPDDDAFGQALARVSVIKLLRAFGIDWFGDVNSDVTFSVDGTSYILNVPTNAFHPQDQPDAQRSPYGLYLRIMHLQDTKSSRAGFVECVNARPRLWL
jgi:hypothetical protein